MPDITLSRQTSLRGQALTNAVNSMVQSISRRSPFNYGQISSRWESATRLTFVGSLSGQSHATGAVDIRDGSPSTVSAQVNLLSDLVRARRAQIEQAMNEEADRALGGAAQPAVGTSPAPSVSTGGSTGRSTSSFDWGSFGLIFSGVVSGIGDAVNEMNAASGKSAPLTVDLIDFSTAMPKAEVPYVEPAPAVMAVDQTTPTWIWVFVSVGVLGVGALAIYALVK